MIDVYNADNKYRKDISLILKHFACSPVAAAERIDSMFASQGDGTMNSDFTVDIRDLASNVITSKTLEEHLGAFCEHAEAFTISKYSLDLKRPLRLMDLWEDDPIGSAGPAVIAPNQLSQSEQKEIELLFKPFVDVIYPEHVRSAFSKAEIKAIKRTYAHNKYFNIELRKRKSRSKAIGEDFDDAQYQEIVWLHLTFKLKSWALSKGFDSFVYANEKEGCGDDSFVTLTPNQAKESGDNLKFLADKYLTEMPAIVKQMLISKIDKPRAITYNAFWGERDPMVYWK